MSSLIERIAILAEREGITIGALERSIGASKGVLSRALQNNTGIHSRWLERIAERYPSYVMWLLTGRASETEGCPVPPAGRARSETGGDDIEGLERRLRHIERILDISSD